MSVGGRSLWLDSAGRTGSDSGSAAAAGKGGSWRAVSGQADTEGRAEAGPGGGAGGDGIR